MGCWRNPPLLSLLAQVCLCMDVSLVLLLSSFLGTCGQRVSTAHHSTVPASLVWDVIKGQIHTALHVNNVMERTVTQQCIPGPDRSCLLLPSQGFWSLEQWIWKALQVC